jgi:hypothetical protein
VLPSGYQLGIILKSEAGMNKSSRNVKTIQRGFRFNPRIWDAVVEDSENRKISYQAVLENILAAYYGLDDLFVEPKAIQRAKALLQKEGYVIEKAPAKKEGDE